MSARRTYSRQQRKEITFLLKNSSGTLRQLSDRFNIPRATLQEWKNAENSPRKSWVTRKPASTNSECELVDWIKSRRPRGLSVTRRDTSEKAMELAPKFDLPNFMASLGWIQKMLKRNGFSIRKSTHTNRKLNFDEEDLVKQEIFCHRKKR